MLDREAVEPSCYYLDELIDTGDMFGKWVLEVDMTTHFSFRGSTYPLKSHFIADVVSRWLSGDRSKAQHQDDRLEMWRKYWW